MYNIYFLCPNLRFPDDDDVQQCTWEGEMKYIIRTYSIIYESS